MNGLHGQPPWIESVSNARLQETYPVSNGEGIHHRLDS